MSKGIFSIEKRYGREAEQQRMSGLKRQVWLNIHGQNTLEAYAAKRGLLPKARKRR